MLPELLNNEMSSSILAERIWRQWWWVFLHTTNHIAFSTVSNWLESHPVVLWLGPSPRLTQSSWNCTVCRVSCQMFLQFPAVVQDGSMVYGLVWLSTVQWSPSNLGLRWLSDHALVQDSLKSQSCLDSGWLRCVLPWSIVAMCTWSVLPCMAQDGSIGFHFSSCHFDRVLLFIRQSFLLVRLVGIRPRCPNSYIHWQ